MARPGMAHPGMARPDPPKFFFALKRLFGPIDPIFRAGWAVKILARKNRADFGPARFWPGPLLAQPARLPPLGERCDDVSAPPNIMHCFSATNNNYFPPKCTNFYTTTFWVLFLNFFPLNALKHNFPFFESMLSEFKSIFFANVSNLIIIIKTSIL